MPDADEDPLAWMSAPVRELVERFEEAAARGHATLGVDEWGRFVWEPRIRADDAGAAADDAATLNTLQTELHRRGLRRRTLGGRVGWVQRFDAAPREKRKSP